VTSSPVTGEPFVSAVVQVLNTTRLKQIKWWRTLEAGAFDVKEVVRLLWLLFCWLSAACGLAASLCDTLCLFLVVKRSLTHLCAAAPDTAPHW
jgi:predicted lysophospholipase L1 biosynthesis ABC-type transport system permease subunit